MIKRQLVPLPSSALYHTDPPDPPAKLKIPNCIRVHSLQATAKPPCFLLVYDPHENSETLHSHAHIPNSSALQQLTLPYLHDLPTHTHWT